MNKSIKFTFVQLVYLDKEIIKIIEQEKQNKTPYFNYYYAICYRLHKRFNLITYYEFIKPKSVQFEPFELMVLKKILEDMDDGDFFQYTFYPIFENLDKTLSKSNVLRLN